MTTTVTENEPRAGVPVPNVELLRATLRDIIKHPDGWNQKSFRACFAYRAMRLTGQPMEWLSDDDETIGYVYLKPNPGEYAPEGRVHAEDRASDALGLTVGQAGELFCPLNTIDDLRRLVADLSGGIGGMDPTFTGGAR